MRLYVSVIARNIKFQSITDTKLNCNNTLFHIFRKNSILLGNLKSACCDIVTILAQIQNTKQDIRYHSCCVVVHNQKGNRSEKYYTIAPKSIRGYIHIERCKIICLCRNVMISVGIQHPGFDSILLRKNERIQGKAAKIISLAKLIYQERGIKSWLVNWEKWQLIKW